MNNETYVLLADVIFVVHFVFTAYIVFGLGIIWLGHFLKWGFIRNFYFRVSHVIAMAVVVAESLFGIFCPLTEAEYRLRILAGEGGRYETTFMAGLSQRFFYFDWDEKTFTAIYVIFFIIILVTYRLIPARR